MLEVYICYKKHLIYIYISDNCDMHSRARMHVLCVRVGVTRHIVVVCIFVYFNLRMKIDPQSRGGRILSMLKKVPEKG